ncbi:MAG: hypothetical protein ACOH15_05085 [Acetobacterium sp.]
MRDKKTNYPEKMSSFISIGLLNMKLALLNMKIGTMINCNKDYSKFLVPKHYGIQWTFNFANPISWFFVFGITVFLVLRVIFKRVKYLSHIGIDKQNGKEK